MWKSVRPDVAGTARNDGQPVGGPMAYLGVFVEREARGGRGNRLYADVPSIDQDKRILAFQVGRSGLDGDRLLLVRD